MLSKEEKREMLEDAKSVKRREHFRAVKKYVSDKCSTDEYLSFLNAVQKIFLPFKISARPTITKFNKL